MIEKIIIGNKTRFNILRIIYENPGISLSAIIRKARTSPNTTLEYVNRLFSHGIIKEERKGGIKKTHLRTFKPDFSSELAIMLYSLIELDKREIFLKRYKELKPYFSQLDSLFKGSNVFILIYGSYARFAAEKDSDLDVLVVGNLNRKDVNSIREIFVTLKAELSLKAEALDSFIKNANKPLHINIIKEHIVSFGAVNYFNAIGKV